MQDAELIQTLIEGKQIAYKALYDQYYQPLFYTSYNIVHNTQEAEDIAIISLNKLFQQHTQFKTIGQLRTWLFLTARNKCIDTLRSKKGCQQILTQFENDVAELASFNDELDAMLIEHLFQIMEQLPTKSKQVIKLKYFEGLKYQEIAAQLNISPRTVENLLRYALNILRNKIHKETVKQ
jgi:RNA polymerase sigma-70 factor (family 1)